MDERLNSMKADFFKAIAHPTRIHLLKQLRKGERCVCEFSEDLDMEQPNISQHLSVLRKQEIVSCRKDGQKVLYKVKYPQVFNILDMVEEILICQVNDTFSLLDKKNNRKEGA